MFLKMAKPSELNLSSWAYMRTTVFTLSFVFAKVVAYYLLFVCLVTTPWRLQTLLICILAFSGAVSVHGW